MTMEHKEVLAKLDQESRAKSPQLSRKTDIILESYINNLLKKSEFTQLDNAGLTSEQKQAWTTYRQTLKDLLIDPKYPNIIVPPPPIYLL